MAEASRCLGFDGREGPLLPFLFFKQSVKILGCPEKNQLCGNGDNFRGFNKKSPEAPTSSINAHNNSQMIINIPKN